MSQVAEIAIDRSAAPQTGEIDALQAALAVQKAAHAREPFPAYEQRVAHLAGLVRLTLDHRDEIAEAISADFGNRSYHETQIAEVYTTLNALRYIKKHLKGWMKAKPRHMPLPMKPARARVEYQPLGAVGIISPWNYPFQLAMIPLANALAAGNRVMLKPSELTPRTSELMAKLLATAFPPELVHVALGGPQVGAAFSELPFDHLLFTGSTAVGRRVMQAAAKNLTPVTLELGGKSPTIVHPAFSVERAANRIVAGKWLNCGQTCIAPDYVLAAEAQVPELVKAIEGEVEKAYPSLAHNRDYTSVINDRHYARLRGLVDDAVARGATKIEINPAGERLDPAARKFPPTLLLNVTDDMAVMQEEIFGPVLPIMGYDSLEQAIDYVNGHDRPLALYYFDDDSARAQRVLERTTSGGAAINDTVLHVAVDDLPFGGVGPSGMGAYHGVEGFEAFSHKKAVFQQARLNGTAMMAPPYGARIERLLKLLLR